jgi:acyl dehydratase
MTESRVLFARYFDELAEGDTFETSGRTVTEADVVGFACLTGDGHLQHVNAHWSAESQFGARIAHGMLVVSYAIGLINLDPERVIALRRIANATFKAPVYLGETISLIGRIERLTPIDDSVALVDSACRIVNQDGRTVVRMDVHTLWRRNPALAERGAAVLEVASA